MLFPLLIQNLNNFRLGWLRLIYVTSYTAGKLTSSLTLILFFFNSYYFLRYFKGYFKILLGGICCEWKWNQMRKYERILEYKLEIAQPENM